MMRTVISRLKKKLKRILFPKKDYLNKGERYDPNIAKYYDPCHVSRYEFAMQNINQQQAVIDIACGTGWGSNMLSQNCKSVTGVDISKDAIKFARKNYMQPNIRFIQSDFFNYSEIGDAVVSFETLEHLNSSAFDEILTKLYSLSRNIIIGSVPFQEIPGNNPFHLSFELNEGDFKFFKGKGELNFLYQDSSGVIYENNNSIKTQNLIFIFKRSQN